MMLAACFALLLASNRRQDAQQNAFLLGLLVALASLMIPEAILFLPFVWGALIMLRAWNNRIFIASLLGLFTVVLYGAIIWLVWPTGLLVRGVESVWLAAFRRSFCWRVLPLWALVTAGVCTAVGIFFQIAHLRRYTAANVRIQTRFLLTLPCFWLALLSCFFPAADGNCLFSALLLSSLYGMVLYLVTYGLPRFSLPTHHSSLKSSRSFGKHSRGSNPFDVRPPAKPAIRSFSRHSRRR